MCECGMRYVLPNGMAVACRHVLVLITHSKNRIRPTYRCVCVNRYRTHAECIKCNDTQRMNILNKENRVVLFAIATWKL